MKSRIIIACIAVLFFQYEVLSLAALLVLAVVGLSSLLKAAANGGAFD